MNKHDTKFRTSKRILICLLPLIALLTGCLETEDAPKPTANGTPVQQTDNGFKGTRTETAESFSSPNTNNPYAPVIGPVQILASPKIIVKKSERKLELWDGSTLCGSYPIALGREPEGDKKEEGDGRTPEGTYYICTRNDKSRFYLSLGISYPNCEDAKEALDAGKIDHATYERIADAIGHKIQPPWDTALGGQIMIHGMGSKNDWTAGCIAVDNDVMDILWKQCKYKTPIVINP